MAHLDDVVAAHHDLKAIVDRLFEEGKTRDALSLLLFANSFEKLTNGDARMDATKIGSVVDLAAIDADTIQAAVVAHIPYFFTSVSPDIDPRAPLSTEPAPKKAFTKSAAEVVTPDSASTNYFADKAISTLFPNLGVALTRAGVQRPRDLTERLQEHGLTLLSARVLSSQYLGLRETKKLERLPFATPAGERVKKILLAALGEAGVALALEGRVTPEGPIPALVSVPNEPTIVEADAKTSEPVRAESKSPEEVAPEPRLNEPTFIEPIGSERASDAPPPPQTPPAVIVVVPPAKARVTPLPRAPVVILPLKQEASKPLPRVPEPYLAGENFFQKFYLGKRPTPDEQRIDVELTSQLMEGGVLSYDALLTRRNEGKVVLPLTHKAIERLQRRARALGINDKLRAGDFRAGKTTVVAPVPETRASPAILEAQAQFARARENVVLPSEARRERRSFEDLRLATISSADHRTLRKFMSRLRQVPAVRNASSMRIGDTKISTASFANMALYSLLLPSTGENQRNAQAFERELVELGVMKHSGGKGYALTPAFLARFTELHDWYVHAQDAPVLPGDKRGHAPRPQP